MQIDHVHFYLDDAPRWRRWFAHAMGFVPIASGSCATDTDTEILRSGPVTLALSSPRSPASPVAPYLADRPPGVAELAFRVADIDFYCASGGDRGRIQTQSDPQGTLRWCSLASPAGIAHTLIERSGSTPPLPHWSEGSPAASAPAAPEVTFSGIDHAVVNVPAGALESTAAWYEATLGFQRQQRFSIQTQQSGLYSQVMVHPDSGVRLPINEPSSANSQIAEFLQANGGPGLQHLALQVQPIAQATRELRQAGVPFLPVPEAYYERLQARSPQLPLSPSEWQVIAEAQVLVDCERSETNGHSEASPLLLQIFTQPIFHCPTFFFELIERRQQAQGFGEGNFQALFEAMEREQLKRASL
ncbi:MAG: 4-hydroxyphenylpyruvate dioxygenase [Cyanobacteria bacterium QS_8_64_29]|nr:MAG: 4-hydroxyphenylpyruvate dioxygenase [Cyanobacteria bacterium QS_8_64_29]